MYEDTLNNTRVTTKMSIFSTCDRAEDCDAGYVCYEGDHVCIQCANINCPGGSDYKPGLCEVFCGNGGKVNPSGKSTER